MRPSVGIVIINFGDSKDTVECLESLKHITYPNYKVNVVNNTEDNRGFGAANNLGVKQLGYMNYYLFLNNDTIVTPDFLDKMIDEAEINNAGICSASLYDYTTQEPQLETYVSGACMLVNGWAFIKSGGFDEKFFLFFEDIDLTRRIREMYPVAHSDAVVYHKGGSSTGGPGSSISRYHYARSKVIYHKKHHEMLGIIGAFRFNLRGVLAGIYSPD